MKKLIKMNIMKILTKANFIKKLKTNSKVRNKL